jgi:hypothetical protein
VSCTIYEKSTELLNLLANSIVDRDPKKKDMVYFSVNEVHLVEQFLNNLLINYKEHDKS